MGQLIYVTGPVRCGKSRFALARALGWGEHVVYVATYRMEPGNQEMQERVRAHREERPPIWRTLEAPGDLSMALSGMHPPPSGVLLDSLTVWLVERLEASDAAILEGWERTLEYLIEAPWPTIVVGNEIGWSMTPEEPAVRRFRDLAGRLAQMTALLSGEAWLLVAGCPVRLK